MYNYKILKTHQIPAEIVEIIDSTEKHCYIVSPYIKPWPLIERSFEKAKKNNKRITVFIRSGEQGKNNILKLQKHYLFELIVLDNLHTKLFFNEKKAIVGSMNLYDTSKEKNHEVALLFETSNISKALKKTIIEDDLLSVTPVEHFHGWFHQQDLLSKAKINSFKSVFYQRGFCVTCGQKMDFDEIYLDKATIVRCKICWNKLPQVFDPFKYKIYYCHFCGETHNSILEEPLHYECKNKLKKYKETDIF